jgi:hypothetical protein
MPSKKNFLKLDFPALAGPKNTIFFITMIFTQKLDKEDSVMQLVRIAAIDIALHNDDLVGLITLDTV